MADVKISALPAATTPLAGTEVLPIVQSSTTKQVAVSNLTAGRAMSATSLTLTTPLAIASGGTGLSALGTGVATALGNNTNAASGLAVLNASGYLAVAQGGTGLGALGTGVATALGNNTNAASGFCVQDASGNLLIGTASSDAKIVAVTTGNVWTGRFLNSSGSGTPNGVQVVVGQNGSNLLFQVGQGTSFASVTNLFSVQGNGLVNTGAASTSPYNNTTATGANMVVSSAGDLQRSTSSLRYKTNVVDATHGLVELMLLRSVTYKGKNDGDKIFGGLIAEEVDAAGLTEFVVYDDEGKPDALHYGNMAGLFVKAIQELAAKITALEAANG